MNQKRDVDMGGAPGYIDVTSPMFNSTTAQRIASLVLSTSNGTETNSSFVLNASNNIRTQVYLVPIASGNNTSSSNSTDGSPIAVNLKVPIFVPTSATVEPYCATFDPTPSAPAPMTVMPCMLEKDAHSSQNFLYYADTGVIHPDWKTAAASQEMLNSMSDSVDDTTDADPQMMVDEVMSESSATPMPTDSASASVRSSSSAATMTESLSGTAAAVETTSMSMTSSIPELPTMTPSVSASSSSMGAQAAGMTTSTASSASPIATGSIPSAAPSGSAGSPSNVTLVFTPANPSVQSESALTSAETSSFESSEATQQNMMTESARDQRMMMDDTDMDMGMASASMTESSASTCKPSAQSSRYPVTPDQSSYEPSSPVGVESYNGPDTSYQDDTTEPQAGSGSGSNNLSMTSTDAPDYTAPYV